jgi:glycosyltransferase involved in cell wall biosynthesis
MLHSRHSFTQPIFTFLAQLLMAFQRVGQQPRQILQSKLSSMGERGVRLLRQMGFFGAYDLVFVIHPGNRGWILDAICQEIAQHFPGKFHFHYATSHLPPAKAYFFSHYSLLPLCLRQKPTLVQQKLLVWYTHPRSLEEVGVSDRELFEALHQATHIICTCSAFVDLLRSQGLPEAKLTYVLGAADPEFFRPHDRSQGAVGFSTAYYARKSPERILEIVQQMPHRPFILLGKNWSQYERFAELTGLENLTYVEAPYGEYPRYYAEMDVFVSPAKLEGGPIPLIEAMMCNVVPVASRTGFAPDLIEHGNNGFLFEVDSSTEVICHLIEQAFQVKTDIRATVEHLSWKNFSLEIQKLLQ